MDKLAQTDFGTFAELQTRIIRMEVVLKKKKKKKKPKADKPPAIPGVDGVIKEEEGEESYYEYYEEEVDEDDPALQAEAIANGTAPPTDGG